METTQQIDVRRLVAQIDPATAAIVSSPEAEIRPVETNLFSEHRFYRVSRMLPTAHILFYVAIRAGMPAVMLSASPKAFGRVIESDPPRIQTAEQAVELVKLFFTLTRSTRKLFYFVESLDELMTLPEPTREERERLDAARARLGDQVRPFEAVEDLGGYWVTGHAVMGRDLVRIEAGVGGRGALEVHIEPVERSLPLVFGV